MAPLRIVRLVAFFAVAFGVLYFALASPFARKTEVNWAVPFGLLPIALLVGVSALVQELATLGPPSRRDGMFGLAAALASFAVLRLAGAF